MAGLLHRRLALLMFRQRDIPGEGRMARRKDHLNDQ
jgi:hypothetical protein